MIAATALVVASTRLRALTPATAAIGSRTPGTHRLTLTTTAAVDRDLVGLGMSALVEAVTAASFGVSEDT